MLLATPSAFTFTCVGDDREHLSIPLAVGPV